MKRVKIQIQNGVAIVADVPAGVEVEITDYDVHAEQTTHRDADGVPCARYVVSRQTLIGIQALTPAGELGSLLGVV
jgi:hypothetical protein